MPHIVKKFVRNCGTVAELENEGERESEGERENERISRDLLFSLSSPLPPLQKKKRIGLSSLTFLDTEHFSLFLTKVTRVSTLHVLKLNRFSFCQRTDPGEVDLSHPHSYPHPYTSTPRFGAQRFWFLFYMYIAMLIRLSIDTAEADAGSGVETFPYSSDSPGPFFP